jgi:hypothetical protein
MLTRKIRITLTEEMLGTASANPDLYRDFIASNRPEGADPAEAEALPPVEDELAKAMTVFTRLGNSPCLWDYQIKGFFKDACGVLARVNGEKNATESSKLKAYRKVIDGLVFVTPRQIKLNLPEGSKVGVCERPLRAQTAQGERVALARSETVPAGTWFEVEINLLDDKHNRILDEWLEYGKLRGLGQWRNSGKGRFLAEELN